MVYPWTYCLAADVADDDDVAAAAALRHRGRWSS